MIRLRPILAIAAIAALTACAAGDPASTTPTPSVSVSYAPDLSGVTVTGDEFKALPTVEFTAPFTVEETLVKVLIEGDGQVVPEGGVVNVVYLGIDGRTKNEFDGSFDADAANSQAVTFTLHGVITGFQKGLEGQKVGSRVLIAMPGKDAYDIYGGNSNAGIEVGDTLLFVVDIVGAGLPHAEGTAVTPEPGLPTVSSGDGKPTVTIPDTNPPAELVSQVLIEGDGEKITAESTIYMKYLAYSWKKKAELVNPVIAATDTTPEYVKDIGGTVWDWTDQGVLSEGLEGWKVGLEGKTVGSRVLLVIPPAQAYPDGNNDLGLEAGDTMVYVIDLLYAE
ncbi:MAG: FKBP-type peptidyl-prolyl cis-trans isomerase [Propionibacteriaceae bacterium]|nr:FKBP-type peptidyl-prolyl cis-trans isomerase [Propionibacteriaceae bacterium]